MKRVRTFLKQHFLWVGFLAVMLPLLVILLLQYRSLTALETALPAWRKEELKNFLREIARTTDTYYRQQAETALSLPASVIGPRQAGVVMVTGAREKILGRLAGVAEHFRAQRFPGAQRFFVVVAARHEGSLWSALAFYDPASATLKMDPSAPEWLPIQLAFAPYGIKIRRFETVKPELAGVDHSPDHHFLFRPIVDDEGRIVGVAGAELDQRYFQETLLPEAIQQAISKHFPGQPHEVVVTAQDAETACG